MLEALEDTLPLIQAENASAVPLIVAHTGDADTVGPQPSGQPGKPPVFAAYDYLHARVRHLAVGCQKENWVDIYDNHDMWPGTLPLFGPVRHRANFDSGAPRPSSIHR